jgi:hypothetical protein
MMEPTLTLVIDEPSGENETKRIGISDRSVISAGLTLYDVVRARVDEIKGIQPQKERRSDELKVALDSLPELLGRDDSVLPKELCSEISHVLKASLGPIADVIDQTGYEKITPEQLVVAGLKGMQNSLSYYFN